MRMVRRRALALTLLLVAVAGACERAAESRVPSGPARPSEALRAPIGGGPITFSKAGDPYRGLGTWIDIYDAEAWDSPEATVEAMAARGVRTIYLQTSNFSRGRPFVHPEGVVRFLDAGAAHGLDVVAWYLPGFRDVRIDLRRTLAAIRLTTPAGNRFDSFALDIESPEVRRQDARTRRLLNLSERLRRIVGSDYRLGAIVPSPRGVRTNTWYWPSFPYRDIADLYDVFLPMTYFTWRVTGRDGAAWYTAKNILILRQETVGMNVPIHVIGGIASDASTQETRGFVDTIRSRDVIGASYYTFPSIRDEQWKALGAIR
ncbi:MAG: hypothetical protein ACRDHU_03780 [Actinomycetota bacterium]